MKKVTLMLVVSAILAYSTSALGTWETLNYEVVDGELTERISDRVDQEGLMFRWDPFKSYGSAGSLLLMKKKGPREQILKGDILVAMTQLPIAAGRPERTVLVDVGQGRFLCKDQLLGQIKFDLRREMAENGDGTACENYSEK